MLGPSGGAPALVLVLRDDGEGFNKGQVAAKPALHEGARRHRRHAQQPSDKVTRQNQQHRRAEHHPEHEARALGLVEGRRQLREQQRRQAQPVGHPVGLLQEIGRDEFRPLQPRAHGDHQEYRRQGVEDLHNPEDWPPARGRLA